MSSSATEGANRSPGRMNVVTSTVLAVSSTRSNVPIRSSSDATVPCLIPWYSVRTTGVSAWYGAASMVTR